jgi:hypothetical protein
VKKVLLQLFMLLVLKSSVLYAQLPGSSRAPQTITYEELYDNPYDISKLFIHLQPIYGEYFSANPSVGFGFEAQYYHKEVFDIKFHARTAYAQRFDLVRDAAFKNATVDNQPRAYTFFEMVGTYHIVDREEDTETKFILYSSRYQGNKWAATVPSHTVIPTKMRRIYGIRSGGFSYATALNYKAVAEKQGIEISDMEGRPAGDNESLYSDMTAQGFYLGFSTTSIKNVAVQPDKVYGTLVNDLIFTAYFDLMATPFINIKDVFDRDIVYPAAQLATNLIGARAGIEGKFNRAVSWAYGAELGYRPGLKNEGFYVNIRMSFPVFSTQMQHRVESFGR